MARPNKITIEVVGPADTHRNSVGQANQVVLRLARLIGRQMARETFRRHLSRTRAEKEDGRADGNHGGLTVS